VFLTDYRHGTIGRISLETPSSRKEMIEKTSSHEPQKIADNNETADTNED